MFTRILTTKERDAIKKYLTNDGAKGQKIRDLVYRANKHKVVSTVEADLALLRKLLLSYERSRLRL
jgi:diaminopimelate decarboxylase